MRDRGVERRTGEIEIENKVKRRDRGRK